MDNPTWRCGHPKTPGNTKVTGDGPRCLMCRQEASRRQWQSRRKAGIAAGTMAPRTGWEDMCVDGSHRLLVAYARYYAKHVRAA